MHFVVHYAEIGLKGRNRPRFERGLERNLARRLSPLRPLRIHKRHGRLLIQLPEGSDPDAVRERLAQVFGVAYFSEATICEPELPALEKAVDGFIEGRRFASFGIRARRSHKSHPFTSNELARHLGARVAARSGARVDLTRPELWIEIHVLAREAILLHGRRPGPGGLPVGSGGRALSLISGGIDSPVASHEMMRRGLELAYAHFHSAPFTNRASQDKVRELVAHLAIHQGPSTLFLIPFAPIQQRLVRDAPAAPRIVLYRRFMIRIAESLARREGALALVTGESLGQVSSQTLGNLDTINRAATVPLLRPLIGSDKGEIVERARAIGTFELSIEPDQDCCSFLAPRNPATWTRPEALSAIEANLPVAEMVNEATEHAERETIAPVS